MRVPGYPYVAAGNSNTKKDAEQNASRDFISYLIRMGKMTDGEGSSETSDIPNPAANMGTGNFIPVNMPQQVKKEAEIGQAYRPVHNQGGRHPNSYMTRAQEKMQVEDAESVDVNAAIHGGWTIENAKAKLHQFLQMNRIKADYRYTPIGPDHARYVIVVISSLRTRKIC